MQKATVLSVLADIAPVRKLEQVVVEKRHKEEEHPQTRDTDSPPLPPPPPHPHHKTTQDHCSPRSKKISSKGHRKGSCIFKKIGMTPWTDILVIEFIVTGMTVL